jgi:hypothetical protein
VAREVVFTNGAASIKQFDWVCDRDSVLLTAVSAAGQSVVSDDPAMTQALSTAPTVTEITEKFFVIPGSTPFPNYKIPIAEGKHIFVATSAAKAVIILVLEDA